ncbi:MAG TPA: dTDP-4-dehydrorhamnose 3,5-epimerase family protein, partial [Marinilabiliaceae bacterium]|nr:dTDP-4-dehydrorhamnose 3,5-epimerase family protein [Marinilabiliaceae bacterium]
MNITTTPLAGLLIIKPKVFKDKRGYFFEAYNEAKYFDAGLKAKFVQDNISYSYQNSIRGLHYQLEPYAQGKLVEVLQGRILDIAVDLRENSATFGQHFSIELSDENQLQFFIPKGFA